MNFFKISFFTLAIAIGGIACKKKPVAGYSTFPINEIFEMKLNQSMKEKDGDLKLTFTGVPEDSRCPKGVNCFHEGQVTVNIASAVTNMSKTLQFTRKPSSKEAASQTFGSYKIQLLEVAPYPEKDKKIDPEDYVIKLAVRK